MLQPFANSSRYFFIGLLCGFAGGCGSTVSQPVAATAAATANSLAANQPGPFSTVLSCWESGDKESAVKQLLLIQWSEPSAISGTPLELSKQEFVQLPNDERTRTQQETLDVAAASTTLGRHTIALGDQAQAAGDRETARAHYQAVRDLGHSLANPVGLFALKGAGNLLVGLAEEKLAALDEA